MFFDVGETLIDEIGALIERGEDHRAALSAATSRTLVPASWPAGPAELAEQVQDLYAEAHFERFGESSTADG